MLQCVLYMSKNKLSLIGIILRWGFLIWELIFIHCGLFCPHLGSFLCCFFFYYVSAKFHLWPSSCDLSRPRIGMLSLVTVSPVITSFHSCCLSHQKITVSNPTEGGQRFTWSKTWCDRQQLWKAVKWPPKDSEVPQAFLKSISQTK